MAYKKFLVVQVEGETTKDLVLGCDGVAASLERQEFKRTAEAPDKSGRYTYFVNHDSPYIAFKKIDGLLETLSEAEQKADRLIAELAKKEAEIKNLKEQLGKEEEDVPETPRPKPKPKPQPKKPDRMRTY